MEGDAKIHGTAVSGTFWYFDATVPGLEEYSVARFYQGDSKPALLNTANVREAKLDLSGFSAVAGIIFRF